MTVASITGGLSTTAPKPRRLRGGMRTRPTSGERMNQAPPPTSTAATSRSPCTVPTWVDTIVITTGATIQMISCSEASSENSGVSCDEFTSFG